MKIKIMSDVHTEFWTDNDYQSPGEGDVLVLAGDIGVAVDLENGERMYRRFLADCSQNYNKVFMVMGNHAHYHGDFLTTESIIRENLPHNFTLLQNQSEYYEGVHFIGSTLWADFMGANPTVIESAGKCMNDYNLVTHGDRHLQPSDTLHEHDETLAWFNQVLDTLRGPKVVITHHCPSFDSLSGRYADGIPGAYATDLRSLVNHYVPNLWIHGHCHIPADYKIGYTRVVSNPFGYAPDSVNTPYTVKEVEV